MHWLSKHARLRDQLSPYLDDALTSAERASLERHLAECDACRAELDQLRLVVGATREFPQVDTPRSFALTPEMLEGRRAAASAPSAPPLALGMRLASAGVAVVLAVVVIGDLSDVGGGSDSARQAADDTAGQFQMLEERSAAEGESDQAETGAIVPVPEATGADDATDGAPADACPPGAAAAPTDAASTAGGAGGPASTGGAGAGAGGGAGGTAGSPAATPIPQPPATPTPDLSAEMLSRCAEQPIAGAVAPTTSAPDPEAARDTAAEGQSAQGALEAADDGGMSTLRILEIVLGGALIALLAGTLLELALRRRRAA
jgi:Putative zinc-finger